jgi:mannose-6-phosphate isomerase
MPVSPPTLTARISALLAHFDTAVLPPWTGAGWNPAMQLAHEALDGATGQPLPDKRYRAMACARQLYVFATAGNLTHADTLFAALQRHFGDGAGGWIYSIDADGQPLDTTRDLYTHAFVVFACAHYHRAGGSAAALDLLRRTVDVIENRFADGSGLYHAALAEDFTPNGSGVLQNPVMHLTEAYLAALEATGDTWFANRLRDLADAVHARFVDAADGCVAELPQGSAGNRIEPGHQFEWYSLVMTARHCSPMRHCHRHCAGRSISRAATAWRTTRWVSARRWMGRGRTGWHRAHLGADRIRPGAGGQGIRRS